MPICGFNQKMVEGLAGFQSGLVEHGIILRSKKKNQSFEQTIQRELDDMARFILEIPGIEDPHVRELTEALTKYACAFYKLVQKRGINNYIKTIDFLTNFYFEMDNKFYSDLEGKPDDMKQLVIHLNKINKSGGKENAPKRI